MPMGRPVRAVVAAATAAAPALAGLRAEPLRCGTDHTCSLHQYCSPATGTCEACYDICHPGTKNYGRDRCETSCQDYLHDLKYQGKNDSIDVTDVMARVEGDVHRLTIMVSVMFVLFIVCFVGLAFYACSSYRKACRRRKTADIESNSIELKKVGAKLANGLAAPAGPPVISPKSSTVPQYAVGGRPSLSFPAKPGEEVKRRSRHPSEDTCPGDYSAVYDNPALVATPPPTGGAAAAAAGGRPLSVGGTSLQSRDSFRPPGSVPSSGRTENGRRPREVDITDMSPATTVEAN
ncbi:uncharacterized protein LOC122381716 [Amphibalanus amphitrite]|uniref:uncharacterized protein LOC122381716 n=1 Tax=Amphibalanus amphitrite TaxID=1232801 RepID=UPI001C90FF1C|nr:uncharacterized protein LOC122381716 [Amphibalanus amphitrite]